MLTAVRSSLALALFEASTTTATLAPTLKLKASKTAFPRTTALHNNFVRVEDTSTKTSPTLKTKGYLLSKQNFKTT